MQSVNAVDKLRFISGADCGMVRLMQMTLPTKSDPKPDRRLSGGEDFRTELAAFNEFGTTTLQEEAEHGETTVPVFVNEFWTAKQRAAHSLHEISYRACFKPQLPRFFIERLTDENDLVLDPFMGRGTTVLESVLLNRRGTSIDVNPLSSMLLRPRLNPPTLAEIERRLSQIDLNRPGEAPDDLLVFYDKDTLRELSSLRRYLAEDADPDDPTDRWLRMAATNRLTGHSKGFFSVYTMPPNQAVTVDRQKLINEKREQKPDYRNVRKLIIKKSKSLLKDITDENRSSFDRYGTGTELATGSASDLSYLPDDSVSLVVTSPPFLDIAQYATDNWLRCWFNGIDADSIPIWSFKKVQDWQEAMTGVFRELQRVLKPGGHVAFEVGEVKNGKVKLEDHVIPAGMDAGLLPELVLINAQEFTKTANCWGVDNKTMGTNTNRIVLFRRES